MTEEEFNKLILCIENCHSLEECIKYYIKPENLIDNNKYQIENNNGNFFIEAKKKYKFKKVPNILIILQTESNFYHGKKWKIIIKLLLKKKRFWWILDNSNNIENTNKEKYILYRIIIHSGSADSGHYFCVAKNFQINSYIQFNDKEITYVKNKKLFFNNLFGGENKEFLIKKENQNEKPLVKEQKKMNSKNAYILIYIKKIK